uniref:Uncharacterized protein n=1 Tax=Anguilla anguilla TaxID=7936 RepID=A0A0E9UYT7_ANGAN
MSYRRRNKLLTGCRSK